MMRFAFFAFFIVWDFFGTTESFALAEENSIQRKPQLRSQSVIQLPNTLIEGITTQQNGNPDEQTKNQRTDSAEGLSIDLSDQSFQPSSSHRSIAQPISVSTGVGAKAIDSTLNEVGVPLIPSPLEFMEKLVALIPRPKIHLTRFYGVLASHYKYRKEITPKTKFNGTAPQPGTEEVTATDGEELPQKLEEDSLPRSKRYSWARLLKRVFQIDIAKCTQCGGNTRIIAAIEEPEVIVQILTHLKLPTRPPRLAPARGPPPTQVGDLGFDQANFFPEVFNEFPQDFA